MSVQVMEGACYSSFLFAASLFFYWQIHWKQLDYSLDTSFLGFFNTAKVRNESSRPHVLIGFVVGAVWQINNTKWRYIGLFLFFLYTIRNLKHLQKLHAGFQRLGIPAPPAIRSSMTRQQMQFHMGIGLGGLIISLTHPEAIITAQWPLMAIDLITLIVGSVHLVLAPVPVKLKEKFRDALANYEE